MTLAQLYEAVHQDERDKNPFDTPEIDKLYDKAYEMFVEPVKDFDESMNAQETLDMLYLKT